jgi:hypothetical protein
MNVTGGTELVNCGPGSHPPPPALGHATVHGSAGPVIAEAGPVLVNAQQGTGPPRQLQKWPGSGTGP